MYRKTANAPTMTMTLDNALDEFVSRYTQHHEDLTIEYDPEWPSPCYTNSAQPGELVKWQPVRQSENNDFRNVEEAMEIALNPQYCAYFTRYFSENLPAKAEQGNCELLQVWNQDDFERLQQNLIGHLLMKKRLKQPPTLFFALTDEDDFILTVDNETGKVMLEQVGKIPAKEIADDLVSFLSGLSPR